MQNFAVLRAVMVAVLIPFLSLLVGAKKKKKQEITYVALSAQVANKIKSSVV